MSSWKSKLYNYGFLMTTDSGISAYDTDIDWESWNMMTFGEYYIWTHPLQKAFVYEYKGNSFLLIGHAYNPFSMESKEEECLKNLAELFDDKSRYYDYFDQLTGVFFYAVIIGNKVISSCDCSGMMGAYYSRINGKYYYSSHSQLIADLLNLTEDNFVTRLKSSKLFHLYGWYLPGDISSYKEISRIIPNTEIICDGNFKINRFYPRKKYEEISEEDYFDTVNEIGQIIHNNLALVIEKWKKPAISLTGGTDSKTTLACASDLQNRFRYFSYVSLPRERVDAEAARDICSSLKLNHNLIEIDTEKDCYPEFDEVDKLMERHNAYLGKGNQNDICKRIVLDREIDFDVEVKSWVSEIARASRYGKYHKKKLPKKVTPRRLTSMYKIFLFNRKEAMETDKVFKKYLENTNLKNALEENGYPWSEFFVWEIVFAGWGGLTLTGEHKLTNDITVPYNNRALLDLMLRVPLKKRMTDSLHRDIIHCMDKRVEDIGIHVVNGNETKIRAICEGIYFDLHSFWPW